MRANSKHLILFLSLAFLTGFQRLLPQTNDFIEGKVINSATSEPVAFATIKLKKNMLGVYANSNGDFRISRNAEFFSDSLIITSIGYKQSSIAYKDLKEKSVNRIMLYPVVYGLAEVKVTASKKKLNSYIIIRRAIRNIRYNYPDKPFNYIAYYRDYQKREDKYLNLNEAIVQALDNGFNTWSRSNKYRLLDFRKNADFPKMNISPYYDVFESSDYNNPNKIIPNAILGDQYGNELFILMVHDAIRNFRTRSFSFVETFSDEFIFNHIFSEPVAVLNNNLLLYKIRFKGRAALTGSDLFASGAIYIQPKDYSIHKLEYACYYKPKNEEMKKMFNIDVEYGYENASDSRLYLKYISFNNFFRVLDPTDESYFRLVNSSWDTFHNIKPCVTLTFNNKIDPVSAARKENAASEKTPGRSTQSG